VFNFFKKKQRTGEPVISFLLLEGESFPVDSFLEDVSKTRFAGKAASEISREDESVFSFYVGDELFALALLPAPYPARDLEGPIATSWIWPPQPPIEAVKQHRAHLLIAMKGGSADPVRRRLIFTAVTALAARQPGVMAVYWPEAALLHYPPAFVSIAGEMESPEAPPLYLWVDLRVFSNQDGTTGLFTIGLSALGHLEIEIPSINMDPGELREWLHSIICYLLKSGPVLKHGQTIGMTAEQKIRIRHCRSSFGHLGKVIRLEP
jgi:hypothetical protein